MPRKSILDKCYSFTEAETARREGWYPYFRPVSTTHGTRVWIDGKEYIMAGSNNYLGLAYDPRLRDAAKRAIDEHGTSCSGSRFMNGTLSLHEELEERLADYVGAEWAVAFTTGYQTNLGAISALLERNAHIVSDKYNHASIMDGVFLADGFHREVKIHRYKHADMEDLENKLRRIPEDEPKLIVTDGVFSMEGDVARYPEIADLGERYGAPVYLDEAHAIGVVGSTGRGTPEHWRDRGVDIGVPAVTMCTFSKSFGSVGGFVAGEKPVVDYIQHHARSLIFSASMAPPQVAAVLAALDIMESEPWRATRMQEITKKMIGGFRELGFNVGVSETPIIPLIIGDDEKTFRFWQAMFDAGVYTNPVISPAVPPNRALIRTSFMAIHSDEELDRVLEVAGEAGRTTGVIEGAPAAV
ncbi:MAG: aminotransferase class I/II-fold pyridoxal phosphate-dependent enzyme [Alkalispirochaetaceae bacterium]